MKILRNGRRNNPPWVGKKVTCDECGCKLKLEKGDRVKLVQDQRDGDYYKLKCPSCGNPITIDASLFEK